MFKKIRAFFQKRKDQKLIKEIRKHGVPKIVLSMIDANTKGLIEMELWPDKVDFVKEDKIKSTKWKLTASYKKVYDPCTFNLDQLMPIMFGSSVSKVKDNKKYTHEIK